MPIALLAAATAGTGLVVANQAKKSLNSVGNTQTGSPDSIYRDPAYEAEVMLNAQKQSAADQYAGYEKYAPMFDQVDMNRMRTVLGASGDATVFDMNRQLTDEANAQTMASNRALREGDLKDVEDLSGRARDISRNTNRELYGSLDRIDAASQAGIAKTDFEQMFGDRATAGFSPITAPSMANANRAQNLGVGTHWVNQQGSNVYADAVRSPQQSMLGRANNMRALFAGPTGIEGALNQQAQDELALGTQLHPEEIRQAQQAARAAAVSRGLGTSNSALAQEVLNTYQAGQNRLNQRRDFAAGANNLMRSGMEADRGYGLNVENQNASNRQLGLQAQLANQQAGLNAQQFNASNLLSREGMNQQAQNASNLAMMGQANQAQLANLEDAYRRDALQSELSFNSQMANNQFAQQQMTNLAQANAMEQGRNSEEYNRLLQAAQSRLSTYQDPYLSILGRQSANVGSNTALYGMGQGSTAANAGVRDMFNPFNSYSQDLNSSNQSAAYNLAVGKMNATAGINSGLMGMFSNLGSSAISAYAK
jgi:hypothetical protein